MSIHNQLLGLCVALIPVACAQPTASVPDAAEFMRGEWSYDRLPPASDGPSLNTGFHVRIAVDSVKGDQFSGRVALWLSGDMLIPPRVFSRVRGVVLETERVTLTISRIDSGEPVILLEGDVVADRLTVRASGGESASPFPVGAVFERNQ